MALDIPTPMTSPISTGQWAKQLDMRKFTDATGVVVIEIEVYDRPREDPE